MLRGFARETEIAWAKDLNKETRRMLDGVDAGRRGFGVVSRRPTLRMGPVIESRKSERSQFPKTEFTIRIVACPP